MAQRKKFNLDNFVGEVQKILKNWNIDEPDKLSGSSLDRAAEIVERNGYSHALAYLEGKYDKDSNYKSEENSKQLAVRDLVALVREHADRRDFASYLIKSIKSILSIHEKEGG